MDYLKSELGLVVFEKRNLPIPSITFDALVHALGPNGQQSSEKSLKVITSFLDCLPVGDKFGSNHKNGREPKRTEVNIRLYQEDPELAQAYWSFYSTNNQFKESKLSLVNVRIEYLRELAQRNGNQELASKLNDIVLQLEAKLNGKEPGSKEKTNPSYDEIDSLDEKLKIVQFFEDKIIEVLTLLS